MSSRGGMQRHRPSCPPLHDSHDSDTKEAAARRWLGVLVAVSLVVVGGCGDDGGSEAEKPAGEPFQVDQEMETGGIEVDAPEGWQVLTMPALGFGLAVPEDWEAVVLSEDGLDLLAEANPEVPDFAMSAVAASQAGAIFYAAGSDSEVETQVNDVKVLVDTSGDVEDVAGLEDYARKMATTEGLENTEFTVVEGASQPTVDIGFQSRATVQHGENAAGKGKEGREDVLVEGAQRVVLSPKGAVYSFIVTSENAATIEDLAPELFDTIAFPPA